MINQANYINKFYKSYVIRLYHFTETGAIVKHKLQLATISVLILSHDKSLRKERVRSHRYKRSTKCQIYKYVHDRGGGKKQTKKVNK